MATNSLANRCELSEAAKGEMQPKITHRACWQHFMLARSVETYRRAADQIGAAASALTSNFPPVNRGFPRIPQGADKEAATI